MNSNSDNNNNSKENSFSTSLQLRINTEKHAIWKEVFVQINNYFIIVFSIIF